VDQKAYLEGEKMDENGREKKKREGKRQVKEKKKMRSNAYHLI
jgi:hypothetical protein